MEFNLQSAEASISYMYGAQKTRSQSTALTRTRDERERLRDRKETAKCRVKGKAIITERLQLTAVI